MPGLFQRGTLFTTSCVTVTDVYLPGSSWRLEASVCSCGSGGGELRAGGAAAADGLSTYSRAGLSLPEAHAFSCCVCRMGVLVLFSRGTLSPDDS